MLRACRAAPLIGSRSSLIVGSTLRSDPTCRRARRQGREQRQPMVGGPDEQRLHLRPGGTHQHRGARPSGGLPADGGEDGQGERLGHGHGGQVEQQRRRLLGEALQQLGPDRDDVGQSEAAVQGDDEVAAVVPDRALDRHRS
jgi:hypothetical protein